MTDYNTELEKDINKWVDLTCKLFFCRKDEAIILWRTVIKTPASFSDLLTFWRMGGIASLYGMRKKLILTCREEMSKFIEEDFIQETNEELRESIIK